VSAGILRAGRSHDAPRNRYRDDHVNSPARVDAHGDPDYDADISSGDAHGNPGYDSDISSGDAKPATDARTDTHTNRDGYRDSRPSAYTRRVR
jgi:hypothetical protein